MAPERQIRELTKCLNRLQQVPDYTQPLVQVMDAALAHVKERQSTELIICSGKVAHCQCTRSFCRAEMGADSRPSMQYEPSWGRHTNRQSAQ